MKDPENGHRPSEDGVSAVGRSEVKSPRRRKGRRGGGNRGAAKPVDAGPDSTAGPSAQPVLAGAGELSHKKRKRRRRSKSAGQNAPAVVQGQGAAIEPSGSRTGANPAPQGGKARHKHRNHHQKRGPQGRPLGAGGNRSAGAVTHAENRTAEGGERVNTQRHAEPRRAPQREGGAAPATASAGHNDLYAALDLGTNNCRLLVAQPTRPGQFRVIDAFSRIVRLGEGLGGSGRLSADAMDRAVEALRVCAAKLQARRIRRMRLIATEACRAAANGEEFLARVTEETGLDLEIIDRETEARLAVSGCSSLVEAEARSVVLFDIGGGSSEIAMIRLGRHRAGGRLANHITHWTSLPVGVVTLSERHGGRDVTPTVFDAMVSEVDGMLARFDCPPVPGAENGGIPDDFHLIGTSGTVTTLAGVHLGLPRYDRRRVDGLWLSDAEVSAMQAKLLSWDFDGRAANPCIGPDRADLVLAGCAILEAIRRRWPSKRMRVADRGLREGLLTDMMMEDGVWRRMGQRPRRSGRGKHTQKDG